jgi:hypothetical protein
MIVDIGGQTADMMFSDGSDASKISTFLAAHSSAGLLGVNELTAVAVTPSAPGSGSDCQRRVSIYAVNQDNEGVRFSIPSPVGMTFEQTEVGERLTAADGQEICDAWKVFSGDTTLTFLEGVVTERE